MPRQYVQKWPDISNGWSDIPSKKEAKKRKKEGGEKTMGKKRKKEEKRVKKRKEKREGRGEGAEEDIIKKRKEKERKKSCDQVFRQRNYCVGSIYRHGQVPKKLSHDNLSTTGHALILFVV